MEGDGDMHAVMVGKVPEALEQLGFHAKAEWEGSGSSKLIVTIKPFPKIGAEYRHGLLEGFKKGLSLAANVEFREGDV